MSLTPDPAPDAEPDETVDTPEPTESTPASEPPETPEPSSGEMTPDATLVDSPETAEVPPKPPRRRPGAAFNALCENRFTLWMLAALHVALLAFVGWRAINEVSRFRPLTDSGVFASAGLHLLHGKVLYRDVWDNKQPVVFALDALALGAGDETFNSVRAMERLFAVARMLLFYAIVVVALRSRWIAFGACLLLSALFYHKKVFEWGNLTEEYATVFVAAGILAALVTVRIKNPRRFATCLLAGFLFSLAAFTKETFLLSSVPWFLYMALPCGRRWREALARTGAFVGGSLIPLAAIVGYFVLHGALSHWFDMIAYNFEYSALNQRSASFAGKVAANWSEVWTRVVSQSWTLQAGLCLAFVGLLVPRFHRDTRFFALAAAGAVVFDYWGTMVSERGLGHYYMQLVPSLVLFAACGPAALYSLLRRRPVFGLPMPIVFAVAIVHFDRPLIRRHVTELAAPWREVEPGAIGRFIRANSEPGDGLWVTSIHYSKHYLESGLLSPTRHIAPHPWHFESTSRRSKESLLADVKQSLLKNPPKFIVYSGNYVFNANGVNDWILDEYVKTPIREGGAPLYVRKTKDNRALWSTSQDDYDRHYAAENIAKGLLEPGPEADALRKRYRGLLFYRFPEVAASVEAVEAEKYENHPRRSFVYKYGPLSGGAMVDRDFGSDTGDALSYTFLLDRDLADARLHARYATKNDGVRLAVVVDGTERATLDLPATDGWGNPRGAEVAAVSLGPLGRGLHSLSLRANGVAVNLDVLYFTEAKVEE